MIRRSGRTRGRRPRRAGGLRPGATVLLAALLVPLLAAAVGVPAAGQTPAAPEAQGAGEGHAAARGTPGAAGRLSGLFPPTHLYRPYLADPVTPRMGISALGFSRVDIADSGSLRSGLELGGRFGLLRWGGPGRRWQLGIEAGFRGWFDAEHSLDNVGWDGVYGLALSHRPGPAWALKLAVRHVSSHLGDEYAERTGRRRIGYTREELHLGLRRDLGERWHLYAEAGYAYELRIAAQEPGRLQAGVEYEAPRSRWGGRAGWYAALDVASVAERDWQADLAVQAGLLIPGGDRRWRLGVSWAATRVPIGEHFLDDESWVSLGLYLDP